MVVANASGSVTSAAATLVVIPPPSITTQPVNSTVAVGRTATFTVAATGSGLTYQWSKGGIAISGATSAMLSIANCKTANAGSYTVIVRNTSGSVTSAAAVLTVR